MSMKVFWEEVRPYLKIAEEIYDEGLWHLPRRRVKVGVEVVEEPADPADPPGVIREHRYLLVGVAPKVIRYEEVKGWVELAERLYDLDTSDLCWESFGTRASEWDEPVLWAFWECD
jgi:hypothetical protein